MQYINIRENRDQVRRAVSGEVQVTATTATANAIGESQYLICNHLAMCHS